MIDRTGVTANVDFNLLLGFDEMEPNFTPNTAPWFLQELRDQLGLKLQSTKGNTNVWVVDHVEHVTEN